MTIVVGLMHIGCAVSSLAGTGRRPASWLFYFGYLPEGIMKSPIAKRSVVVAGLKTSVSLEEAFWESMREISKIREMTLSELVTEIRNNHHQGNLSSAIRVFVLSHFKCRSVPGAISIGTGEFADTRLSPPRMA
jgi:predicted DNA-binding ribbon-helix-helix protein